MKKRILVVEDFTSIRNFVCEMLGSKGYDASGAANAAEAIQILKGTSKEIHLVIADYHMPGESGFDLLLNIKACPTIAHVPVIFLTTESNPEKIRAAEDAGLAAWIKKPYRADHLFQQIKRVIDSVPVS